MSVNVKNTKKNKKKTIGVMTQSRGVMPPPARADEDKKRKSDDRKKVKQKLKSGDYDV
jgi:hypothetical protein